MYKTSKVVFSPRVRKSPYFNSTIKYGAQAFSVYNHMYMPISFEGTVEDYNNLLDGVQLWDVGVERQVQIQGPDAEALSQYLTPLKLMVKVFGDWIKDLGFYKFKEVNHNGIPLVIARMGYSRELCYELFLKDHSKGDELWELLWQAGQELNISGGTPNVILRLEGGFGLIKFIHLSIQEIFYP